MIKIGIIGCGYVGDLHAAAFRLVPDAEVMAVAARLTGKAKHFAKERGIPNAFEDYRQLLAMKEIDLVTLAIPNDLHCEMTLAAALRRKVPLRPPLFSSRIIRSTVMLRSADLHIS